MKSKIALYTTAIVISLVLVVFVISCNIRLPKLEEECNRLEDSYLDAGYRDPTINSTIRAAYNLGKYEELYESMGNYISHVMILSPLDKLFLRFSSVKSIKRYVKYL